jgi:hypothetical protein
MWVHLVTTNFAAGTSGRLRIRTTGTTGFVVADAARWLSASVLPRVNLIATDPIASETGKVARITFSRDPDAVSSEMIVRYRLEGTALNGADVGLLPGTFVLPAGVAAAPLSIAAPADAIAEGHKTLSVILESGTNYATGAFSNAVIQVLDMPFDAWRFSHFTSPELSVPAISGADADPDEDGQTNLDEFKAGTDPRNSSSMLRLTIAPPGSSPFLTFSGVADRSYVLQQRCSLPGGSWIDVTNFPPLSSPGILSYTADHDTTINSNCFFRIFAP